MCANYFCSPGSVCIELSLIVSWARRPTFLIAYISTVNCRALAPTKTLLNGDQTSKAELLLVFQEFSAKAWR